ncbi:MAG: phage head-tail adapter protein, partial [Rhodobacter sp.]|nr:phage head-tail adapter protein [Rhodobacter sp.]
LMERGGRLDVVYDSPLSRAQRSEEGVGILRTFEALTPMANIDPSVLQVINFEEAARVLAAVNGAPRRVIRSPDEMAAIKEQQVQQQQLETLLAAAPVAANTAKTMAQTNTEMAQAPV